MVIGVFIGFRRLAILMGLAVAILAAISGQQAEARLISLAEITVAANERFGIPCDRARNRSRLKARRTFFRAWCANGILLRVYTKKSHIHRIETEARYKKGSDRCALEGCP